MSAANGLAAVQPMHLAQQPEPEPPKLLALPEAVLNVAVGSLALGGAEYIVLQWAARAAVRHGVRLLVMRNASQEWPTPSGIEITRLGGVDIGRRLEMAGARLAAARGHHVHRHGRRCEASASLSARAARACCLACIARSGQRAPGHPWQADGARWLAGMANRSRTDQAPSSTAQASHRNSMNGVAAANRDPANLTKS